MSKPFWNKIGKKNKNAVLKGKMGTLTKQVVAVEPKPVKSIKITKPKRLALTSFELDLTKKVGQLETRLLDMEKDDFTIPTFDDFMEYCKENRHREFCDYFIRRLEKNPRRKPDNATITKVLDILRKMAGQ